MRVLTALVRGSMLAAMLAAAIPSSPSPFACDRGISARGERSSCRAHDSGPAGVPAFSDPCCFYAPVDFAVAPAEMTSRPESVPGGKSFIGASAAHSFGAREPRGAQAPGARESRAAGPPGFLIGEILRL